MISRAFHVAQCDGGSDSRCLTSAGFQPPANGLSSAEIVAFFLLAHTGWRAFECRIFCPACAQRRAK